MRWAHSIDYPGINFAPMFIAYMCLWLTTMQTDSGIGIFPLAHPRGGRQVPLFFTTCSLLQPHGLKGEIKYGIYITPMNGGLKLYAVYGPCSLIYSLEYFCGDFMRIH